MGLSTWEKRENAIVILGLKWPADTVPDVETQKIMPNATLSPTCKGPAANLYLIVF